MLSKDEFMAAFANELRGLLLEGFAEALKPGDFTRNGAFMVRQMRQASDLLERAYARLAAQGSPLPAKPANGQPAKPAGKPETRV